MNERAELVFTFTDVFNDVALQHDITGTGLRRSTRTSWRRRWRTQGCGSGSEPCWHFQVQAADGNGGRLELGSAFAHWIRAHDHFSAATRKLKGAGGDRARKGAHES